VASETSVTGPAAEGGARVDWADVPQDVRAAVEHVCGAVVVRARTQPGGFSPGVAARVLCANGSRFFVKAVSAEVNAESPGLHRREAGILRALDPLIAAGRVPVPRLRGIADIFPWTALVIEDIDGRQPALPWRPDELTLVLAALDRLADALTPSPAAIPEIAELYQEPFRGWRTLAAQPADGRLDEWSRGHLDQLAELESSWASHAGGTTMLHTDVRADNLLLAGGGVFVVDWPHACRGAAFVDPVFLAPSVAMQGGPAPAELLALSRAGSAADPRALAAVVCAMAGYFTQRALRPPPPGLPAVRGFQAAQGEIARRWLADLL
jgi:aminoglycoside phosphotransferase (APT) family kinase protein